MRDGREYKFILWHRCSVVVASLICNTANILELFSSDVSAKVSSEDFFTLLFDDPKHAKESILRQCPVRTERYSLTFENDCSNFSKSYAPMVGKRNFQRRVPSSLMSTARRVCDRPFTGRENKE